jgi:hypothetical protein
MACVEEEFKKGERLGGKVTMEIKWGKSKKEKSREIKFWTPSIMIDSGGTQKGNK